MIVERKDLRERLGVLLGYMLASPVPAKKR